MSDAPDAPPDFGPDAATRLVAWFDARARDLPWRRDRTPYRVLVAEIMLQQTRAATVTPYYARWLRRFPDVRALAAAERGEVLALWEGLGYYRRAHALHDAARAVVRDRGGRFPTDEAGLRELPGVGPYTAAAVATFAHGARTVAVDGNVRRVGARLFARPAPRDEELRERLLPLVPEDRTATGAEALVELGATVCTPRSPACDACPLAPDCRARREGDPAAYPARRRRPAPPERRRWALVRLRDGALWIERRPEGGLLGGMWGPPQREARPAGRALEAVRRTYSHFRLELVPVVADPSPNAPDVAADGRWATRAELAALPLSNVDRAVVARLERAGLLGSDA